MPYSIITEDGIQIDDIPDDIARDADILKQKVAEARAARDGLTLADRVQGAGEVGLQMATGAGAEVAGGLLGSAALVSSGMAKAVLPKGAEEFLGIADRSPVEIGADVVRGTKELLTTDVETKGGLAAQKAIGDSLVGDLGRGFATAEDYLGDKAFDVTGSPEIAAIAKSIPTAIMEVAGGALALRAAKKAGVGQLMYADGRPTEKFRKALQSEGVEFDNINKALIDNIVQPGGRPSESAKGIVKAQLKAGEGGGGLSSVKLNNHGEIVPYVQGIEAVKQGYDKGFVQMAATASPATREGMAKIVKGMRRINDDYSLRTKFRPTDVIGDRLDSRLRHIKGETKKARIRLNEIAATQLKGMPIDSERVVNNFKKSLDDLDVGIDDGLNPEINFKGSIISKDKGSQALINDARDLLAEDVVVDGLRAHKLKRQLDSLIDFKRSESFMGLPESGRRTLMGLRSELNNVLRDASPSYRDVNDTLSSGIRAIEDVEKAMGPSIDIFAPGGVSAMGQDLRGMISNNKSRVRLTNAIDGADRVAKEMGGKYGDDLGQLVSAANALEDVHGAIAKGSLKGNLEGAGKYLTRGKREHVEAAAQWALDKGRGINEHNAFNAIEEVIIRGK